MLVDAMAVGGLNAPCATPRRSGKRTLEILADVAVSNGCRLVVPPNDIREYQFFSHRTNSEYVHLDVDLKQSFAASGPSDSIQNVPETFTLSGLMFEMTTISARCCALW